MANVLQPTGAVPVAARMEKQAFLGLRNPFRPRAANTTTPAASVNSQLPTADQIQTLKKWHAEGSPPYAPYSKGTRFKDLSSAQQKVITDIEAQVASLREYNDNQRQARQSLPAAPVAAPASRASQPSPRGLIAKDQKLLNDLNKMSPQQRLTWINSVAGRSVKPEQRGKHRKSIQALHARLMQDSAYAKTWNDHQALKAAQHSNWLSAGQAGGRTAISPTRQSSGIYEGLPDGTSARTTYEEQAKAIGLTPQQFNMLHPKYQKALTDPTRSYENKLRLKQTLARTNPTVFSDNTKAYPKAVGAIGYNEYIPVTRGGEAGDIQARYNRSPAEDGMGAVTHYSQAGRTSLPRAAMVPQADLLDSVIKHRDSLVGSQQDISPENALAAAVRQHLTDTEGLTDTQADVMLRRLRAHDAIRAMEAGWAARRNAAAFNPPADASPTTTTTTKHDETPTPPSAPAAGERTSSEESSSQKPAGAPTDAPANSEAPVEQVSPFTGAEQTTFSNRLAEAFTDQDNNGLDVNDILDTVDSLPTQGQIAMLESLLEDLQKSNNSTHRAWIAQLQSRINTLKQQQQ